MGYATCYFLTLTPETPGVIPALREFSEEARWGLNDSGRSDGEVKWYEHETEMREFSKKYPDTVFTLKGEGEEAGDIWKKYFQNGKCQVAKARLTIDKFDPNKLI